MNKTEKELAPGHGDEVLLSDEEFVQYNYRDLLSIAAGRDIGRRDWLESYLDSNLNSPEAKSLRKALEDTQR